MSDDLDDLLAAARDAMSKMTSDERQAMFDAQRKSYVRAEMGFGSDADESDYRNALTSGDEVGIAECECKAQERAGKVR